MRLLPRTLKNYCKSVFLQRDLFLSKTFCCSTFKYLRMPGCFPLVDAEKSRSQRLALMAILTWGLQGGGGSPT